MVEVKPVEESISTDPLSVLPRPPARNKHKNLTTSEPVPVLGFPDHLPCDKTVQMMTFHSVNCWLQPAGCEAIFFHFQLRYISVGPESEMLQLFILFIYLTYDLCPIGIFGNCSFPFDLRVALSY